MCLNSNNLIFLCILYYFGNGTAFGSGIRVVWLGAKKPDLKKNLI